ncbi:YihY/virulence factor BrkB family protein [Camelimonas abortus]|uniref:YihY/virulence factor BrkB family protein n=1 Tax=Camelimonas abortus TaxID=1017184 RepID=A0ABV7LCL4_9HYPH
MQERRSAIAAIIRISAATVKRFLDHDGWALASHIAMSILMALFPFIIVVASLASMIGAADLGDRAAGLLFDVWPADIAAPLAREIRTVLSGARSSTLTLGALFALYFASNGIEALRVGLNRAYGAYEWRAWYWTRLESIMYVLLGAAGLMIFAVLVVLWPALWNAVMAWFPAVKEQLQPLRFLVSVVRYGVAGVVIFVVLLAAHLLVAAGRRSFRQVLPGILLTIVAWFVGGAVFGAYIADFGQRGYVTTYAGLASVAIALVFLYVLGAIFLIGGEFNAVLLDEAEKA